MARPQDFKPGQSGNPKGRPPKGYSITEMMKEMLASDPDLKKEIGYKIAEKAKRGDMAAMKMLWQYMDGMPQQNVDLKSGDEPLSITFNFGNDEEK